jgi:hypothetical protein
MASRLAQVLDWSRRNGSGVGLEVLINGVAPVVIYNLADKQLGDVGALMASSGPPILWSIVEFIRRRRVDAIAMLVLAGIVFSLLAFLGGGGAKFLQLRENLVTGLIGMVFLISAAFRRPIFFYLARAAMRRNPGPELERFEEIQESDGFKRTMMVLTLVWGAVLLGRTILSGALVFTLTIPQYLVVHPIVGYASTGGVILWTVLYIRRRRQLGDAQRAREAAGRAALEPDAAAVTP